jgi:hypothetical protein
VSTAAGRLLLSGGDEPSNGLIELARRCDGTPPWEVAESKSRSVHGSPCHGVGREVADPPQIRNELSATGDMVHLAHH